MNANIQSDEILYDGLSKSIIYLGDAKQISKLF